MLSLYDIEEQLLGVFQAIEDQEGEITPEQEQYLAVTEKNFRDKLDGYAKAVKTFESFIDNCKEEEKRIHARRKVYENRIERLKKIMLEAVEMFGTDGKFIETGTFRISSRRSKSVVVNEDRVNAFKLAFAEFIIEMQQNGMLDIDDDVDFQGMIDVINTGIKSELENPDDFIPYTLSDLSNIKINISKENSVKDLVKNDIKYLEAFGDDVFGHIDASISKSETKQYIESFNPDLSVAHIEENKSLIIK